MAERWALECWGVERLPLVLPANGLPGIKAQLIRHRTPLLPLLSSSQKIQLPSISLLRLLADSEFLVLNFTKFQRKIKVVGGLSGDTLKFHN
jgi:hypothetical protein